MTTQLRKISFRLILGSQAALATAIALPYRALAACDPAQGVQGGVGCAPASPTSVPNAITTIVNTMLFLIGIISVIMIIIGGFRYVLSAGNTQNTTAAKDTILYAVIGLVVALLAYAIVNFVLGQFL